MQDTIVVTKPPSRAERRSLRLMIFIGILSVLFFLYSILQPDNKGYLPLYIPLVITIFFYAFKYLHEWYHYYHITVPLKPVSEKIYSVDILTTYCAGEPFDMLEKTLTAIQQITYPHTAWCCDEADDPQVKQLCASLGVQHITRLVKNDAKAGNINNALLHATGELCVVLDPDHVPVPRFLDELVAYFDDAAVGFVQIVQAYYNQAESLVAKGAAQQTYQFYGPVMMTMHSYGTVQAIGANCTFRRAALDSIGGHANGLAEDMHTAMQLHAKGWRSVYVPVVLTRGLVPATMSSYYKQQLKWSRGVWDLFVKVYPKLFSKFTLRQKLHYFTLPFHYLSGLIFFINFLIPVVSLFTGYLPLQMDVLSFLLAALPLFFLGLFIRHYVQKWVAEKTDRGFHLVGGILQIGTWWIHTVGFVYTIIGKKVPYIPTPKNDHDPLPWVYSIPNILIALISAIAIVYGFVKDYTPYTGFMAALASMQIGFMVFILSISGYVHDNSRLNNIATSIRSRTGLIIRAHGFIRRYSLLLSCIVIIAFVAAFIKKQQLPSYLPKPLAGLEVFYYGLYTDGVKAPGEQPTNNSTAVFSSARPSVIALNNFWLNEAAQLPDTVAIANIYARQAIPLLQWRPWVNLYKKISQADSSLAQKILTGVYDKQLQTFAARLAALRRPVFLQYENIEAYTNSDSAAAAVLCWQYVHRQFDHAGADKVIWIWKPSANTRMAAHFPGVGYADWLGVDLFANNDKNFGASTFGFDSLYRPFHRKSLFRGANLPVMIFDNAAQIPVIKNWWNTAFESIDTGFTEIKAIITANAAVFESRKTSLKNADGGPSIADVLKAAGMDYVNNPGHTNSHTAVNNLIFSSKSIIYNKGYYWFRNRHTLTRRAIEKDVREMRRLGINTIERTMPGFYDDKLEQVLTADSMRLIPRFWLLATTEVVDDSLKMQQHKEEILDVIRQNNYRPNIVAWNLGEDVLFAISNQTYKPGYFYYRQQYTRWLADLCSSIRKIDSIRPVIMDLRWDAGGLARYHYYRERVPAIDYFMLEADSKYPQGLLFPLHEKMAWGKVPASLWSRLPAVRVAATLPEWQDIENTDNIALDGLLDLKGRKKDTWVTVMNTWGQEPPVQQPIPDIKILRPAVLTKEDTRMMYRIVYRKDGGNWSLYDGTQENIDFEWYLVRIDQYGNTMFIKKVGEGPAIDLIIPHNPQYYHLYAEAISGDHVKLIHATLNTPLE
jgi:cellulose synthase (UDP-forming)